MDGGAGAYGAGKAQGGFNPLELVQRPPVILRLVNIVSNNFFRVNSLPSSWYPTGHLDPMFLLPTNGFVKT